MSLVRRAKPIDVVEARRLAVAEARAQEASHYPRGDLSRLLEFVYSMHGTPLSVGLFVPFKTAWSAVKEFIETDGELPKSIEWVAGRDLPPEAFPDP
jgi:Immunity protein Imm1